MNLTCCSSTRRSAFILAALVLPVLLLLQGCGQEEEFGDGLGPLPAAIDFNLHVRSILSENCFVCHGPDAGTREAGLRLDTEEGAYAALGEAGERYALVPGSVRRSELYRRITSSDPDYVMPTPDSNLALTDREVAVLRRWIEQGAEYKPHWSFIPPERLDPPAVDAEAWVRNPIDHFVLAELERRGMEPSGEAEREKLIRRVTFDLTGLPPTLEEIDDFLADESLRAWDRVVDRLLASDAYGERLASVWLDVARYADSHGYSLDAPNYMWPWRDWVIDAFNRNLPFDQFTKWQIAGDLLPEPTLEQMVATGFNRLHMQNQEGGVHYEEFRTEYVKDRANTTASTFLGLTMECATCHTHKFDPISDREYYSFYAFFNNVNETGATPIGVPSGPVVPLPDDETAEVIRYLREQVDRSERDLANVPPPGEAAYAGWLGGNASPDRFRPDGGSLYLQVPLDRVAEGGRVTVTGSGSDGPGAIVGELHETEGAEGRALQFSWGNFVNLGGVAQFDRTDRFSFDFRVSPPDSIATEQVPLIGQVSGRVGQGYEIYLDRNRVAVRMMHGWPSNALKVVTTDSLQPGHRYHLAVTYDGSSRADGVRIYRDGELMETRTVHDVLSRGFANNGNLLIGQRAQRGFDDQVRIRFEGLQLTGLRVWSDRLTEAEVLALADPGRLGDRIASAAGSGGNPDPLLQEHYLLRVDGTFGERLEELATLRRQLAAAADTVTTVSVTQERLSPRETHVLQMGMFDSPGERVEPGTPASVLPFPEEYPRNRLGLAQWLVHPDNPLTARVTVNRFWQMLFGAGLVDTPEDFGNQGALPSHPELLDWLAVTFVESGWDVKALLRTIVTSATYRQASDLTPERLEQDPQNRLLARGPRFRLPAEMIRDNALMASGLLVRTVGGPSVHPYQPEGLWEATTTGSGEFATYVQGEGDALYRRSLYTVWKRTSPPPFMTTFDHPARDVHAARRSASSTPLQALVTLNDIQFMEASRLLGERMMQEGGESIDEQLRFAFRIATSRFPQPEELEMLTGMYEEQLDFYIARPEEAKQVAGAGEFPADEALPADELAARTMVASTIFNLYETMMRE